MSGTLPVVSGSGAIVEVNSGSGWWRLPGAGSWTESGGEAPTRDVVAFEAIAQVTGQARAATIALETVSYLARHRAYRAVRKAWQDGSNIQLRLTTPGVLYLSADGLGVATAAVAKDTGIVTFAQAAKEAIENAFKKGEYCPGQALAIGADDAARKLKANIHTIEDVAAGTGVVTVAAPAEAVAAAKFAIILPRYQRPGFACRVSVADIATITADGELTSTFTFTPVGAMPEFEIVDSE